MRSKHVRTWQGWGDTLYQRPIIKALLAKHSSLIVETPIPQFFADIDVTFTLPAFRYRTQELLVKQLDEKAFEWQSPPNGLPIQLAHYERDFRKGLTVFEALERSGNVTITDFDLRMEIPELGEAKKSLSLPKEFVIVKPLTLRKEWSNPSRNCEMESIRTVVKVCKSLGIATVACASTGLGERLVDHDLRCDIEVTDGSVGFFEWMALGQRAIATVGGVGNILPVGMVTGANTFVISGGYQDPRQLVDSRFDYVMETSNGFWHGQRIFVHTPPQSCNCFNHNHECKKEINQDELRESFRSFVDVG
tara:strand:- start:14915 stop:15832 length:918 start_codon:yes stop_codon:yes gene_type:complete